MKHSNRIFLSSTLITFARRPGTFDWRAGFPHIVVTWPRSIGTHKGFTDPNGWNTILFIFTALYSYKEAHWRVFSSKILPFLKLGDTSAHLSISGKALAEIHFFIRWVIGLHCIWAPYFASYSGILSKPVAFLVLTFRKMLNTCVGSTILKQNIELLVAMLSLIYNTL